ncbi:hypothetical protein Hanom_Chr05g00427921 [Helianthus anomalus]
MITLAGKKNNTARIIYVVVPLVCIYVGLIGIGICFFLTKIWQKDGVSKKETASFSTLIAKRTLSSTNDTVGMEAVSVQSLQYDFKTIEVATNYFFFKRTRTGEVRGLREAAAEFGTRVPTGYHIPQPIWLQDDVPSNMQWLGS